MDWKKIMLLPGLIAAMAAVGAAQSPEIHGVRLGDGMQASKAAAARVFAPKPETVDYESDAKEPMGVWYEGVGAKRQTNESLVIGWADNRKVYFITRATSYLLNSTQRPTAEAFVQAMKAKYGEPSASNINRDGGEFHWFFDENYQLLPTQKVPRNCADLRGDSLVSRVNMNMRGLPKIALRGCPIHLFVSYAVPVGNRELVQQFLMQLIDEPTAWRDSQAQRAAEQKQKAAETRHGSTQRPEF